MGPAPMQVWFVCKEKDCRASFRKVNTFLEHKKKKHFNKFQNAKCVIFEEQESEFLVLGPNHFGITGNTNCNNEEPMDTEKTDVSTTSPVPVEQTQPSQSQVLAGRKILPKPAPFPEPTSSVVILQSYLPVVVPVPVVNQPEPVQVPDGINKTISAYEQTANNSDSLVEPKQEWILSNDPDLDNSASTHDHGMDNDNDESNYFISPPNNAYNSEERDPLGSFVYAPNSDSAQLQQRRQSVQTLTHNPGVDSHPPAPALTPDSNVHVDLGVTIKKEPENAVESESESESHLFVNSAPANDASSLKIVSCESVPAPVPASEASSLKIVSCKSVPAPTLGLAAASEASSLKIVSCESVPTPAPASEPSSLKIVSCESVQVQKKVGAPQIESIFKCPLCSKIFGKIQSFKMHMNLHKSQDESSSASATAFASAKISAPAFAPAFATASASAKTAQAQRKEKDKQKGIPTVASFTFKCQECGIAFNCQDNLSSHLSKHAGVSSFKCPYPNCGKAFAYISALDCHMKYHLYAYKCTEDDGKCEYAYKTPVQLARHKRSVHNSSKK